MGFPGGTVVKNLPASQETWDLPLGREDPLEKEMATHSNIFAWEILQRTLVGYNPWGLKRIRHNLVTKQLVHV